MNMTAVQRVVWCTEYVTHKGACHTGSAAVDFALVCDVITLILVTSTVSLWLVNSVSRTGSRGSLSWQSSLDDTQETSASVSLATRCTCAVVYVVV